MCRAQNWALPRWLCVMLSWKPQFSPLQARKLRLQEASSHEISQLRGGEAKSRPIAADTLTLDTELYPPTPVLGPTQTGITLSCAEAPAGLWTISAA